MMISVTSALRLLHQQQQRMLSVTSALRRHLR
jgi:hypothetical protein